MSLLNMNKCRKIVLICFFLIFMFILYVSAKEEGINRDNKKLRDPFHSVLLAKETVQMEAKEVVKSAEDEEKERMEKYEKEIEDELNKIEITAILGNPKGYIVLFKGYTTIYREKDYFNKDKKIKIDEIEKDSVNLVADMDEGKKISRRILFKIE